MKYAFAVKSLVMVEAESEDEAWDLLPQTARDALCDFDYERNPKDDTDTSKQYKYLVTLKSIHTGSTEVLEKFRTEKEAHQYASSRKRRMSIFGILDIVKEETQ